MLNICKDGSSDEEGAVKDGKEDEVDWGGEGLTADEDILRVMGFTGFDTTKVIAFSITDSIM